MKGPFYENDSFHLQFRAGGTCFRACTSDDQWLFHFFFRYFTECLLKNITRFRAALYNMFAKEETIEAASFGALEEAVDLMKKAHELMNQDLRKAKEAFETVAKKLDHVHFASAIKLNVGGQYFTTSLQTGSTKKTWNPESGNRN